MGTRKKLSVDIEAEILTNCRRRCSLCFGLRGDNAEKKGQIAHLDGDPGNNSLDNLVFLCFEHHDEYDSRRSQSKGLTLEEVRRYRRMLLTALGHPNEEELGNVFSQVRALGHQHPFKGSDQKLQECRIRFAEAVASLVSSPLESEAAAAILTEVINQSNEFNEELSQCNLEPESLPLHVEEAESLYRYLAGIIRRASGPGRAQALQYLGDARSNWKYALTRAVKYKAQRKDRADAQ